MKRCEKRDVLRLAINCRSKVNGSASAVPVTENTLRKHPFLFQAGWGACLHFFFSSVYIFILYSLKMRKKQNTCTERKRVKTWVCKAASPSDRSTPNGRDSEFGGGDSDTLYVYEKAALGLMCVPVSAVGSQWRAWSRYLFMFAVCWQYAVYLMPLFFVTSIRSCTLCGPHV